MSPRPPLACLVSLAATLAACSGGDDISYEDLASGTYVSEDDPTVVLEIDVEGVSFSLVSGAGEPLTGTWEALPEDEWTQCCYLNGEGHTKFETVALSPAAIDIGTLSLEGAHLSADGPMLFASGEVDDPESVSGYAFSGE